MGLRPVCSSSLPNYRLWNSGLLYTSADILEPRGSLHKIIFHPSFSRSSAKKLDVHEGEMQMSPLNKESIDQI